MSKRDWREFGCGCLFILAAFGVLFTSWWGVLLLFMDVATAASIAFVGAGVVATWLYWQLATGR